MVRGRRSCRTRRGTANSASDAMSTHRPSNGVPCLTKKAARGEPLTGEEREAKRAGVPALVQGCRVTRWCSRWTGRVVGGLHSSPAYRPEHATAHIESSRDRGEDRGPLLFRFQVLHCFAARQSLRKATGRGAAMGQSCTHAVLPRIPERPLPGMSQATCAMIL